MRLDGRGGLHRTTPSKIAHMVGAENHPDVAKVLAVGAANIPDWDLTGYLFGSAQGAIQPFDQSESDTCFIHSLSSGVYASMAALGLTPLLLSPKEGAAVVYAFEQNAPTGGIAILQDVGAELADGLRALALGLPPMGPPILGRFSDVPNQTPGDGPQGLAAFPQPDEAAMQAGALRPVLGPYATVPSTDNLAIIDAAGVAKIPTQTGGPVGSAYQGLTPGQIAQPEPNGSGHAQLSVFRKTLDASGVITLAGGQSVTVNAPAGTRVRGILNSWGGWCWGGLALVSDAWMLSQWNWMQIAVKP